MTYYQIETFLTVAHVHNLSVAADVLHVTQSTISHRISSLEDELGMILIERQKGRKQTMITTVGEKFVPVAQQWKDLWEETQAIKKKEQQSVLHIVAPNSILLYELKPLLTKICLNEPYLTMFISSNHSVQVRDLLENRTADIGFVSIPIWNKNLILKPILEEPFKLVYHDPEGKMPSKIHPTYLDERKELNHPWGVNYQQWHDYWWPNQPRFRASFDDQMLLKNFLASGDFWAILPQGIAESITREAGNRIIELEDPPQNRVILFAKHRHPKQKSIENIAVFEKYLEDFIPSSRFYIRTNV